MFTARFIIRIFPPKTLIISCWKSNVISALFIDDFKRRKDKIGLGCFQKSGCG